MKLPKVPILRHFSPIETLTTSALINNKTYFLLQNCQIVMLRVSRRLRWAGHILRKQEDSIANLWNSTIEGKRPVGRPRSRWKDQVMKDVRRIKKDISLANNRKEWRKLVDEAKNLLGFQEPQ